MKRQGAQAHRARRDRYAQFAQTLTQELKTQAASRRYTIKRLAKEKAHWFSHGPKAAALASAVIEHCIQPRCLLSPMDADYCAQVIKAIHIMGTPGFSTLMIYDRVSRASRIALPASDSFKMLSLCLSASRGSHQSRGFLVQRVRSEELRFVEFLFSFLIGHADRFYMTGPVGRFLLGILTDLYKWFSDEALYEQDNRTKVGGKVHYLPGFQQSWSSKFLVEKTSLLAWHNFQQVLRKWHRKLFKVGPSSSSCLNCQARRRG
jgi:THO complex subunit 2